MHVWGDKHKHILVRMWDLYGSALNEEEPEGTMAVAAKRQLFSGFKRVAPQFRQLHFTCDWEDIVLLIPQLLALAEKHSPQLEGLELAVALDDNHACKMSLQVGMNIGPSPSCKVGMSFLWVARMQGGVDIKGAGAGRCLLL